MTYIVGVAGLSHIIAGSVEALYAVVSGAGTMGALPCRVSSAGFHRQLDRRRPIGSILNYGQVAPESDP